MAKPEWGVKRTCQSCGARFYDMQRTPIICPKCSSVVEPEVVLKTRRSSAPSAEPKIVAPVVNTDEVELDAEEIEAVEAEEGEIEAEEEDESGLMEDASDLGEDDDDMAEVMEHLDEGMEDEV